MGGDSAPTPPAPVYQAAAPASPSQSYTEMMQWNMDNAQKVQDTNAKFEPQAAALQSQIQAQTSDASAQNFLDLFDKYGSKIADANKKLQVESDPLGQQRLDYITSQLSDAENIPGSETATAFRNLLNNRSRSTTGLSQQLADLGSSDLSLGSKLDKDSIAQLRETARTAQSDRGLAMSPAAAYEEAMTIGNAGEARKQQRIQNAMGIDQLLSSIDASNFGMDAAAIRGLGTEEQQQYSNLNALLGMNTPARLGEATGSFQSAAQPLTTGPVTSTANANTWANLTASQNATNASIYGTMGNMYGSQLQLEGATYESNFNKVMSSVKAASSIAMMGAMCWVAREVYGIDNPKWKVFRGWMLNQAPAWFRNFYIKYGERFANWISNKPVMKLLVRSAMDLILEHNGIYA